MVNESVKVDIKSYLDAGRKYGLGKTDMVAEVCTMFNARPRGVVMYKSRPARKGRYLQWEFECDSDGKYVATDKKDDFENPLSFFHSQSEIGEHYLRLMSKRPSKLTGSYGVAFLCFPDSPVRRVEVSSSAKLYRERQQIRNVFLSNKGSENLPQLLIEKMVELWAEDGF